MRTGHLSGNMAANGAKEKQRRKGLPLLYNSKIYFCFFSLIFDFYRMPFFHGLVILLLTNFNVVAVHAYLT
jgi:hypothetical protein